MTISDNKAETENTTEEFKGLTMRDLIGAPLQAACESQQKLAESALEFMTQIGFEENDLSQARRIKFNLQRPIETPEGITTSTIEVHAPFLTLVPVPSLLIESVDIDFQMEVTSTEKTQENFSSEVSTKAGDKGLFSRVSVDVQGKISSSRENTRSTNQTDKYQVHHIRIGDLQIRGLTIGSEDVTASGTTDNRK